MKECYYCASQGKHMSGCPITIVGQLRIKAEGEEEHHKEYIHQTADSVERLDAKIGELIEKQAKPLVWVKKPTNDGFDTYVTYPVINTPYKPPRRGTIQCSCHDKVLPGACGVCGVLADVECFDECDCCACSEAQEEEFEEEDTQ